jgi:hypothetical protein
MEAKPKNLEELIHRELSKLPERQAPDTLIPRVLAHIQAQAAKSWWRRPWTQWPWGLQLTSVPILLGSAFGFVLMVNLLWTMLPSVSGSGPVAERLISLALVWEVLATLGNALVIVTRSIEPLWLLLGISIPLVMYLTCVGLGTICIRLAFVKR